MVQLSLVTNAMRIPALGGLGRVGGAVQPAIQPGYGLGSSKITLYINPGQSLFGNGWLVGWSSLKPANLLFLRDNFSRDFRFPFLIEAHDLE